MTFGYDDKGRVISKSAFETDGKLKKSWTYEYDVRGNTTLYVVKSGSLTTTFSYNYEYDTQGNWIKRTSNRKMDDFLSAFDSILKASGKTPTPEEKKKAEEEMAKYAPSPEITTREIIYYE